MSRAPLPRAVWVLGFVSLLMDMSSELVHALLPVYLTATLGLSVLAVGVIEGIAEATASMMKLVSGALSDRFARRKPLVLLGYALGALAKPLFPLAGGAGLVVAARFVDRVGKGIRGAPRDAVVADVTPPQQRDAAYGLRQSLDTVGAFAGPLLAVALLAFWTSDLRLVLWAACVPAAAAVLLIVFGLHEPAAPTAPPHERPRWRRATLRALPRAYWRLVVLALLFALARLSEAFLVLRAQSLGIATTWVPLVLIVMSLAYAASAYPAGLLAARRGRNVLLAAGLAVLVPAYGLLAWGGSAGLWAGIALYGVHLGLTQGTLSAAVAAAAPPALRASAFGGFHFVTGVGQLAAGALGGALWTMGAPAWTFTLGAACALAALAVLWAAAQSQPPCACS